MTDTENMADTATAAERPRPRLTALALLLAAWILTANIAFFWTISGAVPAGALGFSADHCTMDRWCQVTRTRTGQPAEKAGVAAGDLVRFESPLADYRSMMHVTLPGDPVALEVRHGAQSQRLIMTVQAFPWTGNNNMALQLSDIALDITSTLATLVGAIVVMRNRGRLSLLLLGLAMICSQSGGASIPFWWWEGLPFRLLMAVANAMILLSAPLFYAFARQYRREDGDRESPVMVAVYWTYTAVVMAWFVVSEGLNQTGHGRLIADAGGMTSLGLTSLGFLMSLAVLAQGWRRAAAEQRRRYAYMVPAVALLATTQVFGLWISLSNQWNPSNPLVMAMNILPLAGVLLLMYAVLRHRVIDLGFAVNQTLIYGVVSFVILLAFGLAEWGIEKVMPTSWREHMEANAIISAGIALCIFLVFHRIRDVVEHVIEGLFFHKWRQNEAHLGRFVKQAAHILKPEALKAAAVAEFARFSGGAETAIYRAAGTTYLRDAGTIKGLEAMLDADALALVALRAEGKPLFAEDAAPLNAALVLPMIQRNDLTGFIVLGPKPGEGAYRPDERAALAQAAYQIGLDLHALRIEELEQTTAELGAQLKLALKLA